MIIPSSSAPSHRWASLVILFAGAIIPVIDVFAVSMILPTIRASLGASAPLDVSLEASGRARSRRSASTFLRPCASFTRPSRG